MTDDASSTLLASKGCGSVIVEAALVLTGLLHRVEEIPFGEPVPGRDRLLALNPLDQVPVLLPGGEVMTESAAMVLHLADRAPEAGLAPPPDDPARPVWRPRRDWFAEHCPKLHAAAQRVDADPRLAAVWARNYG